MAVPPCRGGLRLEDLTVEEGPPHRLTDRKVLHHICAAVPEGSLFTILGRSGSGKTLLNVIAGRQDRHHLRVTGSVRCSHG